MASTAEGKVSSQMTDPLYNTQRFVSKSCDYGAGSRKREVVFGRTFVFCIIRWRGERISATREVEKSISIMAMFPSSLLKILEKGSVW
jgi:hypothetical protein